MAREARDELRALMAGYQRGELEAFEALYVALAPGLRRYLGALSRDPGRVDDLLQETFLQIHRARHAYDPRLPAEPWVFSIARHVFLMDRRSRSRRRESLLDVAGAERPDATGDSAYVARDELENALARITPERRGALLMHHYWGLSFQEIADRLGIGVAAAKLRASRGMRALRRLLAEDDD